MPNVRRQFRPDEADALGIYVYALWDPRDRKVFYVGKGVRNRLFDHFNEAEAAASGQRNLSAKLRRIIEIWEEDLDVKWHIIRRNIFDDQAAEQIEAAVLDALAISQNGLLLNEVSGAGKMNHGALSEEEVAALAARLVDPVGAYEAVFVLSIQNALAAGRSPYDATRSAWPVSHTFRQMQGALAVGLQNGVSKIVCDIGSWEPSQYEGKWEFVGNELAGHELQNKSWLTVLGAAIGYWQRGNYLVVKFDGRQHFQLLRGSADKYRYWSLP